MSAHAHFDDSHLRPGATPAIVRTDSSDRPVPLAESRRNSSAEVEGPIPFSKPGTPIPAHDQLAFVGLGAMGKRMAVNLARSLHESNDPPLIVYNRGEQKLKEFKNYAAMHDLPDEAYVVEKDLRKIGKTADMILTSLGSDEAVEEVYAELFAGQESQEGKGDGIRPGGRGRTTIFVDTSTASLSYQGPTVKADSGQVYPSTAGKMERLASSKPHRSFLSCPVFGIPRAAESAELILAISGDYYARKHVAHALVPAIGKKVMDLGSNVERAMSFKLVGNAMELGFVELLSECFTLSDQAGVGADKLVELIKDQHSSPQLLRYSDRITKNRFDSEGGFNLGGGITDARHIRQLAESHNVPMPVMDVAHQHMLSARAHGGEKLDWTALVGGERLAAGLEPFAGRRKLERLG